MRILCEPVFLIEHYAQRWAKDFLYLLLNMKAKVDMTKSQEQIALSVLQLSAVEPYCGM